MNPKREAPYRNYLSDGRFASKPYISTAMSTYAELIQIFSKNILSIF